MHSIIEFSIGILLIAELLVGLILVLGMFYQYYNNTRVLSTLELGFIILILGGLISVIGSELVNYGVQIGLLEFFSNILWIIAPLAIYYHYEQRSRSEPIYPLVLTLIGLSVLSITMIVVTMTLPDVSGLQNYHQVLDVIGLNSSELISVIVFGFAFYTNYNALQLSDERGVKFELVGTGFIALGFTIIISLRTYGTVVGFPDPFASEIVSHDPFTILVMILIFSFFFLVNIGILILLLNIIIHPNFAYNLPIPIVNFMIYNATGVAVYNKFTEISGIDITFEEQLLSGALKAVSALIEETLGTDASLDHFDAGKFQIFFHQLNDNSSMLVVISIGKSPFIRRSMERFSKKLDDDVLDQLNSSAISNDLIGQIDRNLKIAFPYINLD